VAQGKLRLFSYLSIEGIEDFVFTAIPTGLSLDETMINFRFSQCDHVVMKEDYEEAANGFLELASQQRLAILSRLYDGSVTISVIAKELEATVPEVYRNFERLVKADLIAKNSNGSYGITAMGKMLFSQVSLIGFLSENKKYFKSHDFDQLPEKYLQRIGALGKGKSVKGFVKIQEKWKEIYSDAEKYIYNILFEVPYTPDIMDILVKKVNSGVVVRSIFSEYAIIPKERRQAFDKLGFRELIQQGKIERRMKENVYTIIILNEKEAGVMFPSGGEVDMSEAFFSKDEAFHQWCLDYFGSSWDTSGPFLETRLKE
jgi:predicted transcriptional regulator